MISVKKFSMRYVMVFVSAALAAVCLCGCYSGKQSAPDVTFQQLVGRLADSQSLARLDLSETTLLSSFDPTGGNTDYNHPLRPGPAGWWVIADLKGPGYVSRFWFTGGEPHHGIRLYFDNEKAPRYDTTIGQFCGQQEPFLPPLAAYENYCWYNYVPLPYAKRLIIMVQAGGYQPGGWPRVFHQINYAALPKGTCIETLPRNFSKSDNQALQSVRRAWTNLAACAPVDGMVTQAMVLNLASGQSGALPLIAGPAMIREIRITPQAVAPSMAVDWDSLLRNVIFRIRWDNTAGASVESPIGDFCGNVWRRAKYQGMYFGLSCNTLFARFPMPFAKAAELQFENQTANALALAVEVVTAPIAWDGSHGYFHAAWRRSTPQDVGHPHEILAAVGKGRYAGCILSATTLDKSFWMLEGDELMWRDGAAAPFWKGTGLEDYFNGGWYYQNVLTRPLHGLTFKTFFRTVQYRIHLPDPVMFQQSFRMIFERGPDNASKGWLESVAYYYLDQPRPSPATLLTSHERRPPEDQFTQATIMQELWNYERFGDYDGARQYIDRFLKKQHGFPFAGMLRLRQAAYLERMHGFQTAKPFYEKILAADTNAPVQQQARLLLWFHENPTHSLLGVYCNTDTRVYLDGQFLGAAGSPERMSIIGFELRPGRHVLALQCQYHPYPDWVQACLRMHGGDICTAPFWKHRVNPMGAWTQPDYNDADWATVGGLGCKGPPEEPYIWVEPNALIDMQSKAIGIRPSIEWQDKSKSVVYRCVFDVK
ncbi:MAG: glycoside hydrolase family 172 protein [Verrucomicrobiota bacterium]